MRREIDRFAEIDHFRAVQGLGADYGHGHRQHPGPEAAEVAEGRCVRYRAHGAEIRAFDDEAEAEADDQAGERHQG